MLILTMLQTSNSESRLSLAMAFFSCVTMGESLSLCRPQIAYLSVIMGLISLLGPPLPKVMVTIAGHQGPPTHTVLCPLMAQKHHRGGRAEVPGCLLSAAGALTWGLTGPWSLCLTVFFCNPQGFPLWLAPVSSFSGKAWRGGSGS